MLSDVAAGLRWNASLGAKFLRVVPYVTSAIVLLTLGSQIAMLLASFLPLKVIIMLGSEGTPRYFPEFLAALEREVLIGILSAGTVGCFLIHLAAERMIERATGFASSRLLANSQKMVLFENQHGLAASSYQRYSRALAGGVFISLALLGLGWFYPMMALVMLGYFLFVLLLLWQGARYRVGFRNRLDNELGPLMGVLGTVGFFVAFGFLVFDFIFFTPPGMIVALVSFLLIRQAMQRAAGMIGDLASLYRQKFKLNALFFHGQVFKPLQIESKKSVWPLVVPEARASWVSEVLAALVGDESEKFECYWHQLGSANVAGLRVVGVEQQLLFRLYPRHRSSWALHEAGLMIDQPGALPAPSWVGNTHVEKFPCLVYRLESGRSPSGRQVKRLTMRIHSSLLSVGIQQDKLSRYKRSKAMLWQRLEVSVLERLRVACDTPEQQRALLCLMSKLPLLQKGLAALPVAVHNPETTQYSIWILDDGRPILLDWGRWTLEPVGAGWPETEQTLSMLGEALTEGAAKRAELAEVRVEQAELAALAFALERECNRQRYNQALELIPRILKRLAVLEGAEFPKTIRNVNAG